MDPLPAIEARGLTKRFPATDSLFKGLVAPSLAEPVVNNLHLTIQTGELFGLLGPNGAGKTTLIKMLATLIAPTSGEAWVNGHPLSQPNEIKASLGLVTTDERSFYWRLTGRQNLTFFAHLHLLPPADIPARIEELLVLTNLQEKADQPFRTYSTGMRQRLAIARALLHNPKILFLDEPARGLDPPSARALHHLIRHQLVQEQGLTILLATHWLQEAETLCDRLAILNRGNVQACGTLSELRKMLGTGGQYQIRTGKLPTESPLPSSSTLTQASSSEPMNILTISDDPLALNNVLRTLKNAQVTIHAIEREQIPLETIFERITESFIAQEGENLTRGPQLRSAQNSFFKKVSKTPSLSFSQIRNYLHIAKAFLLRDWQMETSYRLAFLMDFLGIFFSITIFYFVGELVDVQTAPFLQSYGGNYFAFVLVGIAFSRFFGVGIASFANNLRQAQTAGTLEAMLTTPTPLSIIILSSSLWNFGFATLQVISYLIVGAVFLGIPMKDGNILAAISVLGLSILVFNSLGIFAASFVMVFKRGDPISWILNVAFTLLGGVYFPIALLPEWLQTLATLLPVTYGLEAMRLALLQRAGWAIILPYLWPLILFVFFLFPFSLFTFRFAVHRARIDGSLTHY
ncbi:MAG: hypothetical protein Fur0022_34930 [Anaerolineales bacterium]